MDRWLICIFPALVLIRVITLFISISNEKRLKRSGAIEHDKTNSVLLAIAHTLFYFAAFFEGYLTNVGIDAVTIVGFFVYGLAMAALFYVIYQLKGIWTVKLIIASDHKLNTAPIFRNIKHPNYYLNIIPELISITLIFKAPITGIVLFPVYGMILYRRIKNENRIMKKVFPEY